MLMSWEPSKVFQSKGVQFVYTQQCCQENEKNEDKVANKTVNVEIIGNVVKSNFRGRVEKEIGRAGTQEQLEGEEVVKEMRDRNVRGRTRNNYF